MRPRDLHQFAYGGVVGSVAVALMFRTEVMFGYAFGWVAGQWVLIALVHLYFRGEREKQ